MMKINAKQRAIITLFLLRIIIVRNCIAKSGNVIKIDIKSNPLNENDLDELYNICKSYEELFNKRAILFRDRKNNIKSVSEKDYKNMLLTHYSFLKRPVLKIGNKLFIGNTKKVVNNASEYLMNFNRY